MPESKHLALIYHSKDGSTGKMAEAVYLGANHPDIEVEIRKLAALDASLADLLWADALILGTPENFGYMSGAMKHFFDQVYYPAEGRAEGLPYCMFVSAGNDGSGALRSIRRICKGFPFKEVQQPIVCKGSVTDAILLRCEELGLAMAAGIEAGLY